MAISLIIPAGGAGKRFGGETKKQFFLINEKPILYYTLLSMYRAYEFDEVVIGAPVCDYYAIKEILLDLGIVRYKLADAGAERADTVLNAVQMATGEKVVIHDAVRPFVTKEIVANVIAHVAPGCGAICGVRARDTVKRIDKDGVITATENRAEILLAHTPQAFMQDEILQALLYCRDNNIQITDDASAFEAVGKAVIAVPSTVDNIKVTEQADLNLVYSLYDKYILK